MNFDALEMMIPSQAWLVGWWSDRSGDDFCLCPSFSQVPQVDRLAGVQLCKYGIQVRYYT